MNSQVASPKKKPTPVRATIGRLALGHFIAYPIGFLAAIGAMPIGMVVRERALIEAGGGATSGVVKNVARDMNLNPTEAAQVQVLLEFSLAAALAVLLVIHLAAIPWAVGAARTAKNPENPRPAKRGLRAFVIITLATTGLVALTTLAGWVWLLTL